MLHAFGDSNNLAANTFVLKQFPARRFVVSLPLIPIGGDMALYANGAKDAEYAAAAVNLAKQAVQVHSVRLGWEFNFTGTYAWNAGGPGSNQTPANYAAAFRRYALALRAALPGVKICWCPLWDHVEASAWFPGTDVVDALGIDVYLYQRFHADSWQSVLSAPCGISWALAFQAAHGISSLALPEWGTDYDSGQLIENVSAFVRARSDVLVQCFWNSNSGIASKLDSSKPVNSAAYAAAFGGLNGSLGSV